MTEQLNDVTGSKNKPDKEIKEYKRVEEKLQKKHG